MIAIKRITEACEEVCFIDVQYVISIYYISGYQHYRVKARELSIDKDKLAEEVRNIAEVSIACIQSSLALLILISFNTCRNIL